MNDTDKTPAPPAREPANEADLTTASLAGRPAEARAFAKPQDKVAEPSAGTGAMAHPTDEAHDAATPLFSTAETGELRRRWDGIQGGFVDEPRKAVEDADGLVAATMKRLAEIFADERSKLEGQWSRGDQVSTEDLRQALRRYRSFFGRLLEV